LQRDTSAHQMHLPRLVNLSFLLLTFLSNDVVTSVALRGGGLDVKLSTQVGRPFSQELIGDDLRRLWSTGRFEDIRVEAAQREGGTAVMFHVVPSPALRLRDVRIEPSSYTLRIKPAEGTPLNRMRAHLIAEEARTQLESHGYLNPRVDFDFVPVAKGLADLKLTVHAEDPVHVKRIDFSGGDPKELRHQLRALHTRRIAFWKLAPVYSEQAVTADLARVVSLYLSKGYFDAQVRVAETDFHGNDVRLSVAVDSGRRYDIRNPIFCPDLLAERRQSQREGILDFDVRARLDGDEMNTSIQRGRAYRVGRINFTGYRHYGDSTLRREFVLNETEPFDEYKLRKSIARLNRAGFFEPVDAKDVLLSPNESTGAADVNVRVTERKRSKWSFSGPVGPVSLGGPLQGALTSRVPLLPTVTASLSLIAFAHPVVPIASLAVKKFMPVATLQRPFDPGNSWLSGFTIAPQRGWQFSAMSYGAAQLRERLTPLLAGDRELVADLPVTIETRSGERTMLCEPPKMRFTVLRNAAGFGLQVLTAIPSL